VTDPTPVDVETVVRGEFTFVISHRPEPVQVQLSGYDALTQQTVLDPVLGPFGVLVLTTA
jgi:predicted O-linked N-acetylglucosamine transferase (SPINDLY family)